jgi:hypothetical protein
LLLADGREAVPRWRVPNNQPGAEALADRLAQLAPQHGLGRLRIGLEATTLSWWPLACFLQETPRLAAIEREIYALNPKLVHGLKQAYADTGKTDPVEPSSSPSDSDSADCRPPSRWTCALRPSNG